MSVSNHVTLLRFLNGRQVSFHVGRILSAFEPFHSGTLDNVGRLSLRFPGSTPACELRLGRSAVVTRVTSSLELQLPIRAPGFWFCIYCVMREDYVTLVSPTTGLLYANPQTLQHIPEDILDGGERDEMGTFVNGAEEFVAMFEA